MTYACPIEGCEWALHVPEFKGEHAFLECLVAVEVLTHVVGTYGAEGRSPHTAEEVMALGRDALIAAAFPSIEVRV